MVFSDEDKIVIKLLFAINMRKLASLNAENIEICGWITKLEVTNMQFVCISAMSAEYLQKI